MRTLDIRIHNAAGDGFVLHPGSHNGGRTRLDVFVRQKWILGTRGEVRRITTKDSSEDVSGENALPLTLPRNCRAPRGKRNLRHDVSGDVLATYGK